MKEKMTAGPAPGRAASPTIAVPVVAKIPAPMVAPTPSAVRCHLPRVRFRPPRCAMSASKSETDFLAKSWFIAFGFPGRSPLPRDSGVALDAHPVERAVHEDHRYHEEHGGE